MNPIMKLPHYDVKYILTTLSETKNYGIQLHNVPEAWKYSKGEGVIIAILDTGLPSHRDLQGQIIDSANFTHDGIKDLNGHGTHVSGVIAALEDDQGVIGIAPKSKLLIGKCLDDSGAGDDDSISAAINWAIQKGANVINMSLGCPEEMRPYFPKTEKAIKDAYNNNVVFICAAGNENADKVGFPASLKETISVAAVDSSKQRANFSNYGSRLDFAASGVNILSTYKNNAYAELSGTSQACPQIAGIAALIISKHKNGAENDTPINSVEDLREHIRAICVDLGNTGKDVDFGNGLPVFGHYSVSAPVKRNWLKRLFGRFFN